MPYVPTEEAKSSPRNWSFGGKRVGLGGPITTKVSPPKLPQLIAEATPTQYEAAFKAGLVHLVKFIPEREKDK